MSSLATVILAPPLAALSAPLPIEAAVAAPLVEAGQARTSDAGVPLIDPSLAGLSWSLTDSLAQQEQDQQSGQSGQGSQDNDPEEPLNEIIVRPGYGPPDEDPLIRINERAFDITEGVDQAVVGPIAYAYEETLPSPIRDASRNFLRNLREPTNLVNFLLQGKFGKAFETLGRFTINSTLGLGGLIDIAEKPGIGLPYRRTGFSDTLGFYGVGDGPFLVLPLIGSTTVRDLVGTGLDQSLLPFVFGKPFNTPEYGVPAFILNSLNFRLEFDEQLTEIRDSGYPYEELRIQYLAKRHFEIDLLQDGDDRAGIPGAYLEFKRSQEQTEPSTREQVPEATAPVSRPVEQPDADALPLAITNRSESSEGVPQPYIAPHMEAVLLLE